MTEVFIRQDLATPIGTMIVLTDGAGRLRALDWLDYEDRLTRLLARYYGGRAGVQPGRIDDAVRQGLERYFAGEREAIDVLPVALPGTAFQRQVWAALRDIPCGRTWSYANLASHIGRPLAVRAVGAANGANPVGVVVPCHRVIGADGSLTGYGGGLHRKHWLLAHEGAGQLL